MRFLFLLTLMIGCEAHDMANQARVDPYEPSAFFANDRSARWPVTGTIAQGSLDQNIPARLTRADLVRGEERYNINCAPCHGRTGLGNGMIVQRGYSRPPNFFAADKRTMTADYIYRVISGGFGAMPSYAEQVTPRDRWVISSYIKALQLSREVPLEDIPPAEQQKLREAKP